MELMDLSCFSRQSNTHQSYHELWIRNPAHEWECFDVCHGCLLSAHRICRKYEDDMWSKDCRRWEMEWAADEEQVNTEIASMLERSNGRIYSAEQIYIRRKKSAVA